MSRFRIYVRDKPDIVTQYMPLLGELDTYTDFKAVSRHNAVGSWSLNMPAGIEQASLIAPGRGIVVFRDNDQNFPVFSGPIRQIDRSWSKDAAGAGTVSVTGVCDNTFLRERIGRVTPEQDWPYEGHTETFPTSGGDAPKQSWDAIVYDPSARPPNNSGEFIYGLVASNYLVRHFSGDWDPSRAYLALNMDPAPSDSLKALPDDDLWKGFPINMSNLETTVFALAEAAGLAVSIQWQTTSKTDMSTDGRGLFLNITPIADKSETVVFDPSAGNLSSYTLSSVAPDATRVIVGGQVTEGARRWFSIRKNDFFDPIGWIDRDDRDSFGNRYFGATSDGVWGRQKIEIDWNTTAETFVDARDINWEFQVRSDDDAIASISPRPGSDVAIQVDRETVKALVENGPKGLLTMTAVDSPACTFGVDYFVSDVVRVLLDNSFLPESMRPEDGLLREVVREVTLSSTASAIWTIEPSIGTSDSSPTPYVYKQLKKLRSKVEDVASLNVVDPLSSARPTEMSLQVSPNANIQTDDANTSLYCKTQRPRVNQKYQVLLGTIGDVGQPGFASQADSEIMLDVKNGEDGDWVRQSNVQNYPTSDKFWYAELVMTGSVGDVQYIRARATRGGAVSDWSKPTLKLTAAAGAINTSGTLTLSTPPGVHHANAIFNLTGTDTTRAQLWLQVENPVGSGYETLFTAPTFSGTSGNNYAIEHQVPDHPGSYKVRVITTQEMGIGKGFGTIIGGPTPAVTITVV